MGRRYAIKSRPRSWVERDKKGRFKNWINKSRSLAIDRMKKAAKIVKPGYGGQGDLPKRAMKKQAKILR